MSYKFIVPYLMTASTMLLGFNSGNARERDADNDTKNVKLDISQLKDSVVQNAPADSTANLFTAPRLENARPNGKGVVYEYSDGTKIERKDNGSRAWRNNNPGNLRYYQFAKNHGAVAEAGGFAVFPNEEMGMEALIALLQSDSYNKLTIANALKRYDPTNYVNYARNLCKLTGLSKSTVLGKLTHSQLLEVAKTIRILEGWKPGTEQTTKGNQHSQQTNNMFVIQQNKRSNG